MSLSGEGPPTEQVDLLTTAEFAKECGVQPSTVRGWVLEGLLEPDERLTTNGRMKFHPSKLTRFIQRTEKPVAS